MCWQMWQLAQVPQQSISLSAVTMFLLMLHQLSRM
jgi:hypothetical protein